MRDLGHMCRFLGLPKSFKEMWASAFECILLTCFEEFGHCSVFRKSFDPATSIFEEGKRIVRGSFRVLGTGELQR